MYGNRANFGLPVFGRFTSFGQIIETEIMIDLQFMSTPEPKNHMFSV